MITMNEIPKEVLELDRLIEQNELNATATAKAIGISPASLSKLRKGGYNADMGNMQKKIAQYLQLQKERREILPKAPFVETLVARKVMRLCRMAHVERKMVVLAGQSGIGKTMALRKYSLENKSVIYIAANSASGMQTTIYRIAQLAGTSVVGDTSIRAERIIGALKGTNKVIIVDEADHLKLNAIEMIRYIHDQAGIGVVLSGWQEMIHTITGGGSGEGKYSRIYTRCGAIESLRPISKKDARLIVEAILGQTKQDIVEKFYEVSNKCPRIMVMLIPHAWKKAKETNRGRITPQIIEEAKKRLIII